MKLKKLIKMHVDFKLNITHLSPWFIQKFLCVLRVKDEGFENTPFYVHNKLLKNSGVMKLRRIFRLLIKTRLLVKSSDHIRTNLF